MYNPSSSYGWYWATEFSSTHDGTNGFAAAPAALAAPPSAPVSFAANVRAAIASPLAGYVSASAMQLSLAPAWGAWEYWLEVGSVPGAADYYNASLGLNTAAQVGGLRVGTTVYVRLWTLSGSGWLFQDYSYQTTV